MEPCFRRNALAASEYVVVQKRIDFNIFIIVKVIALTASPHY
jgi:hypothetical protein